VRLDRLRQLRAWILASPWRAAALGFLWFVPGFLLLHLVVDASDFAAEFGEEVLRSGVAGLLLTVLLYVIVKRRQREA